MGLVVVAHEPADWQRWLDARLKPPAKPVTIEALRGQQLFNEIGCAACHRVAGTAAQGISGPDLTFVGSRLSLGAGILPNTRGTLVGWIGDSQSIKPNNRMPSYRSLQADELNALAAYLESLK
jgi:cytochrome c oxidase subunit 2